MSVQSLPQSREKKATSRTSFVVAKFDSPGSILNAARALNENEFLDWEAYSPQPIHGIDEVSQRKTTLLPYLVAIGAVIGIAIGLCMPWYFNAVDYPYIISGKPLFALEASLPVAFELAILLAAFGAFGGVFLLGGLGTFKKTFRDQSQLAGVTNDEFALVIPYQVDKQSSRILRILDEYDVLSTTTISEAEDTDENIPSWINWLMMTGAILLLIPPVIIAKMRVFPSEKPRIHLIGDMDWQPKFKAQSTSNIFQDGRSSRPQVPGTISVGDLKENPELHYGKKSKSSNAEAWINYIPMTVDRSMLMRGRERYQIYCATCHGIAGDGDGLVTTRALSLEQGTWVRPTSLHDERICNQPLGQLYDIITNGVRKMPGYSSQIDVQDRWAITAYVKALQKTRSSSIDAIPPEERETLVELQ